MGKQQKKHPHPTGLHDIEWQKPDFLFQRFGNFTVKKKQCSKIFWSLDVITMEQF